MAIDDVSWGGTNCAQADPPAIALSGLMYRMGDPPISGKAYIELPKDSDGNNETKQSRSPMMEKIPNEATMRPCNRNRVDARADGLRSAGTHQEILS